MTQKETIHNMNRSLRELEELASRITCGNLPHLRANIVTGLRYNIELLFNLKVPETRVYISLMNSKSSEMENSIRISQYEKLLNIHGISTVNPLRLVNPELNNVQVTRAFLIELLQCSHILITNDPLTRTKMGQYEYDLSIATGIRRIYLNEIGQWLTDRK